MSCNAEYQVYAKRRKNLVERLARYCTQPGVLVLIGAFEAERFNFHQEHTFFYFTGLVEPGLVLTVEIPSGHTVIWEPAYTVPRHVWSMIEQPCSPDTVEQYACHAYRFCGDAVTGMSVRPCVDLCHYQELCSYLRSHVRVGGVLFGIQSLLSAGEQIPCRYLFDRLHASLSILPQHYIDIGTVVQDMRRTKDAYEVAQLKAAVAVTALAHEQAALGIRNGESEAQIRARIMQAYIQSGAEAAFPSIVASGKQATMLHYNRGNHLCAEGELVLVDIGAQLNYYCADITRMYPVSGQLTARQRELYDLVLALQDTIQGAAVPGMWLGNKERPECSLQHRAYAFLKEHGFSPEVMPHSIGHWLGLDTHDLGDYSTPLREGDVFTIEPGIYLPDEGIGIRVEDNYWICDGKAQCLSLGVPKANR